MSPEGNFLGNSLGIFLGKFLERISWPGNFLAGSKTRPHLAKFGLTRREPSGSRLMTRAACARLARANKKNK